MSRITIPSNLVGLDELLAAGLSRVLNSGLMFDVAATRASGSQLLYETSLIQWLITYFSAAHAGDTIEIVSPDRTGSLLEVASTQAPGAFVGLLPPGTVEGVSRKTASAFRDRFLANQARWPDLSVTDSAFLLCLDTVSDGLPPQLYPQGVRGEVVQWTGARAAVRLLMNAVAGDLKLSARMEGAIELLATIVLELFKNTHDHARRGVAGDIVPNSVRVIYARFYSSALLRATLPAGEGAVLNQAERYAAQVVAPRVVVDRAANHRRSIAGLLELSIVDSGPGLAHRWLGRDSASSAIEDELHAVLECFGKGRSSLAGSGRGFGLWKVLANLRELKGFLRLRTNRLHVCRQFHLMPDYQMDEFADGVRRPKERLFDWRLGLTAKAFAYPSVVGTLVSVLVPIPD
jgi:hypothetical protein